MIKSVTVTNPKGESLKLDLFNPHPSGLAIRDISGLGPPQANINSIELATTDGSLFSSARTPSRNIVLNLIMLPSPTIEDARQRTYRYFPLKKRIELVIETDNRTLRASGYVEHNEPDIFSQMESCQISIICVDPYFYSTERYQTEFSVVTPLFEFPFSNESLTEDLLEMGTINLDTRTTLEYLGDIDTGVLINLHLLGPIKNVTLYNVETLESIRIDTDKIQSLIGRDLGLGDDINISTVSGQKYVECVHDGLVTNVISSIDKDADWFIVSTGKNIFNFVAEEGTDLLTVSFSYYNAYGGI